MEHLQGGTLLVAIILSALLCGYAVASIRTGVYGHTLQEKLEVHLHYDRRSQTHACMHEGSIAILLFPIRMQLE